MCGTTPPRARTSTMLEPRRLTTHRMRSCSAGSSCDVSASCVTCLRRLLMAARRRYVVYLAYSPRPSPPGRRRRCTRPPHVKVQRCRRGVLRRRQAQPADGCQSHVLRQGRTTVHHIEGIRETWRRDVLAAGAVEEGGGCAPCVRPSIRPRSSSSTAAPLGSYFWKARARRPHWRNNSHVSRNSLQRAYAATAC